MHVYMLIGLNRNAKDLYMYLIALSFKGIVSKLTIKFWMCQKYMQMRDINQKMNTSVVE
jgi:hypothetical protein